MTYELRIERQFDALPELVFDAFVDKTAQGVLHGAERKGWNVEVIQTDVRVGGTSIVRMGPVGREPDTETRVYSVVDRPQRLELRHSMELAESGLTIDTQITITFEERDGGTLFTMVESGFEVEEHRDGFLEGWTEFLETLGGLLKTRHDT
ncbi:MAG: SRPBCC family protein [Actinomycetota bacterium]